MTDRKAVLANHPLTTILCWLQDRLQILTLVVTLLTLFYGILLSTDWMTKLDDENDRSTQVVPPHPDQL